MADRVKADEYLSLAAAAKEVGELDTALAFYQESLKIWLELYKIEPEGTLAKKHLLSVLEVNMAEAERLKQIIKCNKEIADAELAKKAEADAKRAKAAKDFANSSSFGSIWRRDQPSNDDTSKAAATERKPARKAATPKAPLPDTHDYNTVKPKPKTAAAAVRPISRGRTGSSDSGKQKIPASPSAKKTNEYEEQIMSEMLDSSPGIKWDDIAGLAFAKQTLQEAVILPNLRPDLFTGLRSPPKGVLLFGPPGTGKTLLAKAVATESGFAFFSISSSSVTSKYLGEGEKLMKALFEVARQKQPAVIFFDEIDALMSARKDNEHEASRRLKTEFMTQVDGTTTSSEDRILIMAATNIPWELDEAVLRRLAKRIYVPLPDAVARKALIRHLLKKQSASTEGKPPMDDKKITAIVKLTEGYSGSDLAAVCQEAAMGPIRELAPDALRTVKAEDVRQVNEKDFAAAVRIIRPSVSPASLATFTKWSDSYGVSSK